MESALNPMQIYYMNVTPENLVFIAGVVWHRIFFKITGNNDPISSPYITGDTFRSLATHKYDRRQTFSPSDVAEKDIVFVASELLHEFFTKIHPHIKNRYVLITHNEDTNIDSKWTGFIDSRIIHWFGQNVAIKHSKITPIPIGIENLDYYNHGVPAFFSKLQAKKVVKKNLIVFGFSIHTNPKERQKAYNYISHFPYAREVGGRLNGYRYLEMANRYAFVLSPPGHGIDCIRTWEALYLGVIPIVKRGVATEYFASLGLPLWIVDSWDELDAFTPTTLKEKYKKMMKKADTQPLFFSYWKDRITSYVT